ncbi:MAG TPA: hypothetical protein DCS93_02110 [Microscillaceae bacterium]|nr:hypothetical protein [Microscillaceae bacterium]
MEAKTADTSVTTVVRHFIKTDKTHLFEEWVKGITAAAQQFEGFKGLQLIHPPEGHTDYLILFKFSDFQTLEQWMNSDERAQEIEKLDGLYEKEMVLREVTGIDFWFEAPDTKNVGAPPKWKMAVLTWLLVFPGVVIVSKLFRLIFPSFSPILITLCVTLFLVPLLTWVLMPNVVKLLKGWLFKGVQH